MNKRLSIINKTYKLQGSLSPTSTGKENKSSLNLTSANLSNLNCHSNTAIVSRRNNNNINNNNSMSR